MFTGIVREVGVVVDADGDAAGLDLLVSAPGIGATTAIGDSIALDGV
jgi:riboflavin synthase alpha subunit